MGRRAARVLFGMGLASCALLAGRSLVSDAAPVGAAERVSSIVRGAVDATGAPAVAPGSGWTSGHVSTGRYLVAVEGDHVVAVDTWEGVATASVTPVGDGVAIVGFTSPTGEPVDAGFTFVARSAG